MLCICTCTVSDSGAKLYFLKENLSCLNLLEVKYLFQTNLLYTEKITKDDVTKHEAVL